LLIGKLDLEYEHPVNANNKVILKGAIEDVPFLSLHESGEGEGTSELGEVIDGKVKGTMIIDVRA